MPRPLLSTKKSSLTVDVLYLVDFAGNHVITPSALTHQAASPAIDRKALTRKKSPLTT